MAARPERIVRRPPRALQLREQRKDQGGLLGRAKMSPAKVDEGLLPHMQRLVNEPGPLSQNDAEMVAHYLGRVANRYTQHRSK